MITNDIINACFEFGGGLAILNHARIAYRDKAVKGVSILSTVFFTAWGCWNAYYYPSLDQWASFIGSIFICLANAAWVILLIKYHYFKKTF